MPYVDCCENELPETLELVISASGDCAVDDSIVIYLYWGGASWGDGVPGGYVLWCDGGFYLDGPGGLGFQATPASSANCDPLGLVFETQCSDYSTYTVTITAA